MFETEGTDFAGTQSDLYANPLHDDSKFTPSEIEEHQMWGRRTDDINRQLDEYTYEIN